MHSHLMNGASLEELEQRFNDTSCAQSLAHPADPAGPRVPAEPAQQAARPDNHQECSLAEYEKLEIGARKQILERLDAWRSEDRRIERIFANLKHRRTSRVETKP
jgi:hypothetical protein